jgi:hypothetical protein
MPGLTLPTWFRPGSSRRYGGSAGFFFSVTAVFEEVAFLWKEEQRNSEKKRQGTDKGHVLF